MSLRACARVSVRVRAPFSEAVGAYACAQRWLQTRRQQDPRSGVMSPRNPSPRVKKCAKSTIDSASESAFHAGTLARFALGSSSIRTSSRPDAQGGTTVPCASVSLRPILGRAYVSLRPILGRGHRRTGPTLVCRFRPPDQPEFPASDSDKWNTSADHHRHHQGTRLDSCCAP